MGYITVSDIFLILSCITSIIALVISILNRKD